ncbi:MBL fold metallo-hydrolase [Rubrivivax gelatinosus]|uniref:MBL fold metallo-hydrolase n=1 Tax=Rubrivivax gelatinosus TaxID=28068 RepID=UPI00030F8216|nr:MBL fold metallo-hydrolase [Rubrivivax gelatinosus]MBG6079668.1 glyoxylase-like metal-dependent hydrolase (beta-lactamase superfamily II) [Rubrivivax gelatinosus]
MESAAFVRSAFGQLGLQLFERGWLSSNNVLFRASRSTPATIVDTGYGSHEAQTQALVQEALGDVALERIVNTHLHSDHVGGNAGLQAHWGCETLVPEPSFDLAWRWDETRLSYEHTGQTCPRFKVDSPLEAGEILRLGDYGWKVAAAPGHDPDAVLLYQPDSGVVLTGDALWEQRLAIVFPALEDDRAFDDALSALDLVERLAPRVVIPGHGRAFTDVAGAVQRSRQRLHQFIRQPERHLDYAERALLMFHMLEHRRRTVSELLTWLASTPVFVRIVARRGLETGEAEINARRVVDSLLAGGQLQRHGEWVTLPGSPG